MNPNSRRAIWLGVVFLTVWAIVFGILGYKIFGVATFGPNFYGAIVGASVGGVVSLLAIIISFVIEGQRRAKDLNFSRFIFLRRQAEELKNFYIAFIQTMNLSGPNTSILERRS